MALRFLVVEGNARDARLAHRSAFGMMPCESYAALLQEIEPGAVCDLAFPADEGANLPDPAGLQAYDGVVLTGSALNLYDRTPAVLRQIDLMRAVYASGTPAFGSCWGLQVGAAAAGGEVQKNPQGREVGFARRITPTETGRLHPMLAGRPPAYDAPAIHLDIVTVSPADCTVLSFNANSAIQAAEIRADGGSLWGVQYHPEFSLLELATILERRAEILVREGFCESLEDAAAYVADLAALDAEPHRQDLAWRHGLDAEVLDPVRRTREIRNFVEH
ncbi:MAG: type 1 glutamine amidotransferase, partial [Pseudomonadota bacterium]|nr:type 1 glutamine amidotransferase [Pseudomonadota bacterium]